jgi:IS30 family transposase
MEAHLRRGLSPAQIQSTLARMPDPVRLSRETIYTALYAMPNCLRPIVIGWNVASNQRSKAPIFGEPINSRII